jgi:hypothetical protein
MVLTELAYEKAEKPGLKLIRKRAEASPSARLPAFDKPEVDARQKSTADISPATAPKKASSGMSCSSLQGHLK